MDDDENTVFFPDDEFTDAAFVAEVHAEAELLFWERRAAISAALIPPGHASIPRPALPPSPRPAQEAKGSGRSFVLGLSLILLVVVIGMGVYGRNAQSTSRSSSPSSNVRVSAPDYTVTAPNELSPARIDQLLAQNNSPAQGNGQVIYDLGVKYGLNDIYFPAWFQVETSMGKGGVASVFNPTGMECSDLCPSCSGADANGRNWCVFYSWPQGFEAWFQEISQRYVTGLIDNGYRLTTVELIACGPNGTGMYDGGTGCHSYAATIERIVDQWRASGGS